MNTNPANPMLTVIELSKVQSGPVPPPTPDLINLYARTDNNLYLQQADGTVSQVGAVPSTLPVPTPISGGGVNRVLFENGSRNLATDSKLTYDGTLLKQNGYVLSATETSDGNSGSAKTIDFSVGSAHTVAMTANCTFTLSNAVAGGAYVLRLVQDATGSRTYTWPGNVKWPGAVAPAASGANATDLINLYYDGTSFYGSSALNY